VLPASSILPQPVDHCATGCFIGPNAAPPGRGIRVLSLFDGIACGLTALKRANIKVDRYVAFEIDKYAISIAKKNHPEIEECGDVAGADFTQFRGFDFVIGGSPCQGFSFAGKQLNFNDPRSGLFFEFVHAVREVRPKHFLLENVVMKKEYEAVISNALGVEPIMINSALVSAQNRKRLYWSDIPIVQPADHGVLWGDIRQRDIPPGGIYYTPFGLDWIRRHEERTGKKLKIIADTDKMQMLEATMYKKYSA
jgi:site-specific DNA-cytosine methylase